MNKIVRTKPYYKGVTRDLMSPSQPTGKLRYEVGTIVEANGLDENTIKDCGKGINFCSTLAQALKWGPVVVELTVPDGETIIDAGDKLRAKRVRVEAVANLRYANLAGSDLSGSNLSHSNLSHSNLAGANLSHSNLSHSNLCYVNLRGAGLSHSNLSGSNLAGSDLSHSDLSGSNLWGADLRGADLWSATVNSDTIISLLDGWEVVDDVVRRRK